MSVNRIEHIGNITCIDGCHVQVKIRQLSSCSSCEVRKMCPSSDIKEKIIDIIDNNTSMYSVGQEVRVFGSQKMARKAIFMAFGLPLLFALIWIPISVSVFHMKDVIAVGMLFVIYAVYFIIIYLFRNKLGKDFIFRIEKI